MESRTTVEHSYMQSRAAHSISLCNCEQKWLNTQEQPRHAVEVLESMWACMQTIIVTRHWMLYCSHDHTILHLLIQHSLSLYDTSSMTAHSHGMDDNVCTHACMVSWTKFTCMWGCLPLLAPDNFLVSWPCEADATSVDSYIYQSHCYVQHSISSTYFVSSHAHLQICPGNCIRRKWKWSQVQKWMRKLKWRRKSEIFPLIITSKQKV